MKNISAYCVGIFLMSSLSVISSLTGGLKLTREGFLLMTAVAVLSFLFALATLAGHFFNRRKKSEIPKTD